MYFIYFKFNLSFIIKIFIFVFAQGYLIILVRKFFIIGLYVFLWNDNLNICEIKSVSLIKLNIRLRLHHFKQLVGGNVIKSVFIINYYFLIDKYLNLILNVFIDYNVCCNKVQNMNRESVD